jgi:hypothetical protein
LGGAEARPELNRKEVVVMAHGDHVGDLIDDFVFAMSKGYEADARFLRRRVVAVAFIPGLLLVMMLGQWTHSGVVAVAGLVVLVTAMALGILLPGKKS